MRLSLYIGALFIVVLAFATYSSIFTDLSQSQVYNITVNETFQGTYTNASELLGVAEEAMNLSLDLTNESRTAKQLEGDFEDPSKSQVKATKMVYGGFGIVKNLVIETSSLLHAPPILAYVFWGIFIIVVTFSIISLIFRFRT